MTYMFIDFEASSLDPEGWPIEVGVSWLDGGTVRVYDELMRPDPTWLMTAWSSQSAAVHGISLDQLRDAAPAAEVAQRVASLLGRHIVISDAPEFDGRWLRRLLDLLPTPHYIPLVDFDEVAHSRFGPRELDWVYETLERLRAPHRAGPDARRLAKSWAAGVRGVP